MKKLFTILILLALIGWSGVYKCYSQEQWSLAGTYTTAATTAILDCTDDYFFTSRTGNDTIYVYSVATGDILHKEKIFVPWTFFVINNKLFISNSSNNLRFYDISDINNWSLVQTMSGFDKGWIQKLDNSTDYVAWIGHWAGTYQMIDISGPSMVLKCKVNTGGNSYGGGIFGDYVYVSNAYSQCTRININNPSACSVSNFGASLVNHCYVTQTGLVVHDEGYAAINRIKIYNQNNTLTGQTIVPSEVLYVLPLSFLLIIN